MLEGGATIQVPFVDLKAQYAGIKSEIDAAWQRVVSNASFILGKEVADFRPLRDIARRHGLWLIEDAAQAVAAEYEGERCGNIGDLACFSFYPSKNLGAYGDAGAVTGNDDSLLARVRKLRDHGRTSKY